MSKPKGSQFLLHTVQDYLVEFIIPAHQKAIFSKLIFYIFAAMVLKQSAKWF
jgi:hypothetical protein